MERRTTCYFQGQFLGVPISLILQYSWMTSEIYVKANLSNRSVLYIVTDISVTSLLDRSNPEVTLITMVVSIRPKVTCLYH